MYGQKTSYQPHLIDFLFFCWLLSEIFFLGLSDWAENIKIYNIIETTYSYLQKVLYIVYTKNISKRTNKNLTRKLN